MIKKLALIYLVSAASAAVAGDWGYKENGNDWPQLKDIENNSCGNTKQSPIDLPMVVAPQSIVNSKDDQFNKIYTNPKDVEVTWTGKTSYISLPKDDVNLFQSWHNHKTRKTCHLWDAVQFHWHHESEHTIDGKRYDLELHVVHAP